MYFLKIHKLVAQFRSTYVWYSRDCGFPFEHLIMGTVLVPWFSDFALYGYYKDSGFPKSTAIATIPPMATIQRVRVP